MARNAATVIGNSRDPAHLPLLERGLTDIGWEVREACAWALGRFGNRKARGSVERSLADPDERVVQTAQRSLEGEFLAE